MPGPYPHLEEALQDAIVDVFANSEAIHDMIRAKLDDAWDDLASSGTVADVLSEALAIATTYQPGERTCPTCGQDVRGMLRGAASRKPSPAKRRK